MPGSSVLRDEFKFNKERTERYGLTSRLISRDKILCDLVTFVSPDGVTCVRETELL